MQEIESSFPAFGVVSLQLGAEGIDGSFAVGVDVVGHSRQLNLELMAWCQNSKEQLFRIFICNIKPCIQWLSMHIIYIFIVPRTTLVAVMGSPMLTDPPPRNRSMKYEAITFWHNQCPHYKGILIQKSNNYSIKSDDDRIGKLTVRNSAITKSLLFLSNQLWNYHLPKESISRLVNWKHKQTQENLLLRTSIETHLLNANKLFDRLLKHVLNQFRPERSW